VLKRTRTLSGVSVVATLTASYPCRNQCLYCPEENKMPKSYLSNEPAVMRAIKLDFDPYLQVQKRIGALELNGHDASKVELIIMGGTFSHLPVLYQYWFVLNCFLAANAFSGSKKNSKVRALNLEAKNILKKYFLRAKEEMFVAGRSLTKNKKKIKPSSKIAEKEKDCFLKDDGKILAKIKMALLAAQKENQIAKHRIVGLTLETRPDSINLKELVRFRKLGCTRVEIGVQSVFTRVLKKNERGHGRQEIIKATQLLKELGFKINYHLMPGLWGSSFKLDQKLFGEVFSNQVFRPDMLKIYPCVVVAGSPLFSIWQQGLYHPYSNDELFRLLAFVKKRIPRYVRIARVIRDIPTDSIVAGPNIPNLREMLKKRGVVCQCIRCREAGRIVWEKSAPVKLKRTNYKASGGQEIFLEFLTKEALHAFLRLRIPAFILKKKPTPLKELKGAAMIREVHSYGQVAPIGEKIKGTSQHQGFGKRLIKEAEKIVKEEYKLKKIAVIAAEGTKEYYFSLGFKEEGLYLMKEI
jgi:elongator complex protein 3